MTIDHSQRTPRIVTELHDRIIPAAPITGPLYLEDFLSLAAKVVQTAADRGLTQHTDTATLLNQGAPEVIEAYRNLGPAVAHLDAIAGLRNQLTAVAHVGPVEHPMAAFVTGIDSALDLDGAHNVWSGESEIVQRQLPLNGSHLARIRKQRLGGAWLALVCAGYTLRLNTGSEAEAVVRTAHSGNAA
jgi:hypothetical protein